jgi:hypothetical protein
MNRKRIIWIFVGALVVALAAALYFVFHKTNYSSSIPSGGGGNTLGSSSSFTPSGKSPSSSQESGSTDSGIPAPLPRLRHLTDSPTSGDIVIQRDVDVIKDRVKVKETDYFVRYMERATGHIFEINTNSPAAAEISNATLPKVYEAIFAPGGNSLVARFLSATNPDQILSYYIELKDKKQATTTPGTVASASANAKTLKDAAGAYLPIDLRELVMSPSGAKILTLSYTNGGGKISVSSTNGSNVKSVLTHPLREWLLDMIGDGKAVITTKPSAIADGYAYALDVATGSLKKIIGNIAGLTVLPRNDGAALIGAGSNQGTINTFVYLVEGAKKIPLALTTLPEKCAWSNTDKSVVYCAVPEFIPQASYPDVWYQGRLTFTDDLWKINVSSGETNLISNLPKESTQKIDAINLTLSADDSYITFINKVDLTLWGLNLKLKQ